MFTGKSNAIKRINLHGPNSKSQFGNEKGSVESCYSREVKTISAWYNPIADTSVLSCKAKKIITNLLSVGVVLLDTSWLMISQSTRSWSLRKKTHYKIMNILTPSLAFRSRSLSKRYFGLFGRRSWSSSGDYQYSCNSSIICYTYLEKATNHGYIVSRAIASAQSPHIVALVKMSRSSGQIRKGEISTKCAPRPQATE